MPKSSLLYIALSAICLVGGAVAAFEAGRPGSMVSPPPSPSLSVASAIHDFGRVRQRETLEATFFLKNNSPDTLRVMGTPTDCGCTVAKMDSPVVAPGEETKLHVTFAVGAARGQVERMVTVRYLVEKGDGSKELKSLPLGVRANVVPDFRFEPAELRFRRDTSDLKTTSFQPVGMSDVEILGVSSTSSAFSVRQSSATRLDVSFNPTFYNNPMDVGAYIVVKTSSPREPVHRLPLVVER